MYQRPWLKSSNILPSCPAFLHNIPTMHYADRIMRKRTQMVGRGVQVEVKFSIKGESETSRIHLHVDVFVTAHHVLDSVQTFLNVLLHIIHKRHQAEVLALFT